VSAAPLPLTSLEEDITALNRSLDRTEGPIVLAGHAYAGAVIALARPERVKALVYVTALAPDEGEKVADVFYRLEPHPKAPKLAPDSNGLIWLPEAAFATAFAQNASAEDRTVLAAVSGRFHWTASLFRPDARFGRTFRAGIWLPKTTA